MIAPLPDRLLEEVSNFVTTEFGLLFSSDRRNELARGVSAAAQELGRPNVAEWAGTVIAGRASLEQLRVFANHLTISETYFFRQRDTFTILERIILPDLTVRRRQQNRPLQIWSAGCASGEEPYSIAILLRQLYPGTDAKSAAIFGTDLNSHVLARARRGVYSEWSFRDAPPWLKGTYFEPTVGGRHQISEPIRQMVQFSQLNFAVPLYPAPFSAPGAFDVILCRNVLMYFSIAWQEAILRRFVGALALGGWLLVGPCDVNAALAADLNLRLHGPGIFEKCAPGDHAKQPPDHAIAALVVEPPAAPTFGVDHSPAAPALAQLPGALPECELMSNRARAHADRGELDQALATCDQALVLEATNPDYHYLRACILLELDRHPEAAQALQRVLYFDPRAVMAEFTLGSLAERDGRTRDSRHHFSIVLRLLSPQNRGDLVPRSEGLTVARLREVVQTTLGSPAL